MGTRVGHGAGPKIVDEILELRSGHAFTGIQTGPRQLELPPNMPEFDSAGR